MTFVLLHLVHFRGSSDPMYLYLSIEYEISLNILTYGYMLDYLALSLGIPPVGIFAGEKEKIRVCKVECA